MKVELPFYRRASSKTRLWDQVQSVSRVVNTAVSLQSEFRQATELVKMSANPESVGKQGGSIFQFCSYGPF